MFRPRTPARLIARLLIGVLVFAQGVLAVHACPPAATRMMNTSANVVGTGPAAELFADVTPVEPWRMDAAPERCAAHCQSGQQNADVRPASTPPVALMAAHFTLEAGTRSSAPALPLVGAPRPPALPDPPHAILHCRLRI